MRNFSLLDIWRFQSRTHGVKAYQKSTTMLHTPAAVDIVAGSIGHVPSGRSRFHRYSTGVHENQNKKSDTTTRTPRTTTGNRMTTWCKRDVSSSVMFLPKPWKEAIVSMTSYAMKRTYADESLASLASQIAMIPRF